MQWEKATVPQQASAWPSNKVIVAVNGESLERAAYSEMQHITVPSGLNISGLRSTSRKTHKRWSRLKAADVTNDQHFGPPPHSCLYFSIQPPLEFRPSACFQVWSLTGGPQFHGSHWWTSADRQHASIAVELLLRLTVCWRRWVLEGWCVHKDGTVIAVKVIKERCERLV